MINPQILRFAIHRSMIINANHRLHPMVKARKVTELRTLARISTRSQRVEPITTRQLVEALFFYGDGRRPDDPANLHPTVKPLLDGMVDAGWAPDDSREWVKGPLVDVVDGWDRRLPKGMVRVEFTWRPAWTPQRIQLSRRKGYRKPEGAIVVSRPSKWGNPFRAVPRLRGWAVIDENGVDYPLFYNARIGAHLRAVDLFREFVLPTLDLEPLRGHDLCCWCPITDQHGTRIPCHADAILDALQEQA